MKKISTFKNMVNEEKIEVIGKQLKEKLKREGKLVGKEAELYEKYCILQSRKYLSQISILI